MNYTHSITSKGQVTIPKEFRERLGLDKAGKATFRLTDQNEIVLTVPKELNEVRALLSQPSFKDPLSKKEKLIATQLAQKYGVN